MAEYSGVTGEQSLNLLVKANGSGYKQLENDLSWV